MTLTLHIPETVPFSFLKLPYIFPKLYLSTATRLERVWEKLGERKCTPVCPLPYSREDLSRTNNSNVLFESPFIWFLLDPSLSVNLVCLAGDSIPMFMVL